MQLEYLWIIQSCENQNIIGCFTEKQAAEKHIHQHQLKCTLTQYPIDISVYDWAIAHQYWTPKSDLQKSSKFKERFNSAYLDHDHYGQNQD